MFSNFEQLLPLAKVDPADRLADRVPTNPQRAPAAGSRSGRELEWQRPVRYVPEWWRRRRLSHAVAAVRAPRVGLSTTPRPRAPPGPAAIHPPGLSIAPFLYTRTVPRPVDPLLLSGRAGRRLHKYTNQASSLPPPETQPVVHTSSPRSSSAMAPDVRVLLRLAAAALVAAMCATAAATQQAVPAPAPRSGLRPLPSIYRVLTQGQYKRNQELTCPDPKTKQPGCVTKCEPRCPNQCIVVCPGCKTYCST